MKTTVAMSMAAAGMSTAVASMSMDMAVAGTGMKMGMAAAATGIMTGTGLPSVKAAPGLGRVLLLPCVQHPACPET